MARIQVELRFLKTLFTLNLASAMEYRASFITQIAGMFINNGIYFVFWVLFFDKFGSVQGYMTRDVFLLFGLVASGYGLGHMVAGNVSHHLAYLIAQGRLDYYLVFPRALLPHVIGSRMQVSAIGDFLFGLMAYLFVGSLLPVDILLYLLVLLLVASNIIAYSIMCGSLAFFFGDARNLSMQMSNALLTFSMYPMGFFGGTTRVVLFTLIPAGFVSAIPVQILQLRDGFLLVVLFGVTVVLWVLATAVFHFGLRRYESGSAMNINI